MEGGGRLPSGYLTKKYWSHNLKMRTFPYFKMYIVKSKLEPVIILYKIYFFELNNIGSKKSCKIYSSGKIFDKNIKTDLKSKP